MNNKIDWQTDSITSLQCGDSAWCQQFDGGTMLLSWCTLVIDAIWYSISPNESIGSLDFFCSLYPPLAWCIITKSVLWINSDGHTKLATLPYYSKYVPPARMTLGGVGNVHKTVDFNHQAVFFIRKVYVSTSKRIATVANQFALKQNNDFPTKTRSLLVAMLGS